MKKRIYKIQIPPFKDSDPIRYLLLFMGKVKRVAFRNEALLLAERLEVTGYVKNVKEGVLLEIEGPKDKLSFFLNHILSVNRFIITNYDIKEIPTKKDKEFNKL